MEAEASAYYVGINSAFTIAVLSKLLVQPFMQSCENFRIFGSVSNNVFAGSSKGPKLLKR